MSSPIDASEAGTNAGTVIGAYLQATNDADHDALRKLVTAEFELVMGEQTVSGIENVMALQSPEHVKTTLSLQGVTAAGQSFLVAIEQRVSWINSDEPSDTRQVRARFFFSGTLISRVELLG